MKKLITLTLCIALAFTFVACKKNKESDGTTGGSINKISGTIYNMPSGSDFNLKLVYDDDTDIVFATAPVSSNGLFSLNLPGSVDSRLLYDYYTSDDAPTGLTVSPAEARMAYAYLELWDGDEYVGYIEYGNKDRENVESYLVYVDGAKTVYGSFGTGDGTQSYAINFKKGWNWEFGIFGGDDSKYTSTIPAGTVFYFPEYYKKR